MAKSYRVGIVGEANYQKAIAGLRVGEIVQLRPEPDNPHDPRAVAVVDGDGATIGYLPREHWLKDALLDQGKTAMATVGDLHMGETATGVVLDVSLDAGTSASPSQGAGTSKATAPADVKLTRSRRAAGGCLFLIGFVMLIVMCTPESDSPPVSGAAETASLSGSGEAPQEEPANDPRISAGEFSEIESGMSQARVEGIIGGPGEILSENTIGGTRTVMIKWDGESGFGANANVMFQNDAMVSKAQFGLE